MRSMVELTRLGLGTAPLAGLYEPVDESTALAVDERALLAKAAESLARGALHVLAALASALRCAVTDSETACETHLP